jgi:hypothetical protein
MKHVVITGIPRSHGGAYGVGATEADAVRAAEKNHGDPRGLGYTHLTYPDEGKFAINAMGAWSVTCVPAEAFTQCEVPATRKGRGRK